MFILYFHGKIFCVMCIPLIKVVLGGKTTALAVFKGDSAISEKVWSHISRIRHILSKFM